MPGRRLRLALVPALASLTVLAACSAPDEPTAPSATPLTPLQPSAAISDATQGSGDPHFFWLPPIAPSRTYPGTFDAGLQPQIRICRVSALPCSNPLVTFPSSAIAVNTAGQSYSVDWSTKPTNITPDDYRAEVWIAGRKMGFADIRVVLNAKDLKSVPAGFVGVLKSKSLTLAFRLELGIVAAIDVTPRNPTVDSAKTVQLAATIRDFHNQVIPNAVVTCLRSSIPPRALRGRWPRSSPLSSRPAVLTSRPLRSRRFQATPRLGCRRHQRPVSPSARRIGSCT